MRKFRFREILTNQIFNSWGHRQDLWPVPLSPSHFQTQQRAEVSRLMGHSKDSLCILGNHRNWDINQLCSGAASDSRSWHGHPTGGSSSEQLFLAWVASALWERLVRWDSGSFVPSSEVPAIVHLQRGTDCAAEWLKNAKVGTGDNPSWRPLNRESLRCLVLFQPSDSVVETFQQDTWKPLVLFSKDSFRGIYLKKKCNSVHFPSLYYPEHQIAANSCGADSPTFFG